MRRMIELASVGILLIVALGPGAAWGTNHIDHGPTGTANHDYFDESEDTQRLIKNIEFHHMGRPFWDKYRAGEYRGAIAELVYTLERIVNHPQALTLMVSLSRTTKSPTLPTTFFEKALSLYPQHAITHAQYGQYLVETGQMEPGIQRLNEALKLDPNLAQAHAGMALAYHKAGNREAAREAARRARELGYRGRLDFSEDEGGASRAGRSER